MVDFCKEEVPSSCFKRTYSNKVTFDHAFSSMYMSNPLLGSLCDIFHWHYWLLFTYLMVSGPFCILTEQVQNNEQPLIG